MIRSTLLTKLGFVHGFSTRTESREKFLGILGSRAEDLVIGEQIHGTKIAVVKKSDAGHILPGTDGLISKHLPIGVTYADCVPILAVDPRAKIIGTAHAGWKGTLAGIAKELVLAMRNIGAKDIFVSIGPSIGVCCYNVEEERARMFEKKFGKSIAAKISGEWYVDLARANVKLLHDAGARTDHIDVSGICTSCNIDKFNSYRKDEKADFGLQLAVISL